MKSSRRITVAGAGFSGLATAFFLLREGFKVRVVEARPQEGGLIRTIETDHGFVETAANGILNSALVEDLFETIGLPQQPTLKESRRRYIFRDGKPQRWPFGIGATFTFIAFIIKFFFVRSTIAPRPQETVREWGFRVLGREITEYGIEAALQGIYAGDPGRMSATLIFGKHFGFKKAAKKPKIRGTISASHGMGELISKLKTYLEQNGVEFDFSETLALSERPVEPTVVATSAHAAAKALRVLDSERARACDSVELLPVHTTTVFFDEPAKRAQGFGCLFPPKENKPMLGALMNSFIFPNRTKAGYSETWIFGGASKHAPQVLALSDQELLNVIQEQRKLCFQSSARVLSATVTRWPAALPHYTCELEKALPIIRENRQNVFLIGNYTGEIGLARILERAQALAKEISDEGKWF